MFVNQFTVAADVGAGHDRFTLPIADVMGRVFDLPTQNKGHNRSNEEEEKEDFDKNAINCCRKTNPLKAV